MGEVYRARDSRLNRTVAIKVLPSALTADSLALQRFEREARAVAALSHPHVCPVHDVGHHNGINYLVLEFLDGETLAHRLIRGKLPLDQALQYATQIASGLAAAHDAGLIHRDIKPGNIMLTKSGAMLLDFGLAKVPEPQGPDASFTITAEQPVTAAGTVLGTVQYMAPEQIEGRPADRRSDIFSFGAVLHEMVSGRRAFRGETSSSIVTALLTATPEPLTTIDPTIPATLDHLVRLCLEKEPARRWQSAADVARQLEWITADRTAARPSTARSRTSVAMPLTLAALAGIAVGVVAAAIWTAGNSASRNAGAQPVRFEIRLAPGTQIVGPPAISRDGSHIVYAVGEKDSRRLYLRPLDRLESTPLPNTDFGIMPFFSPDGQSLAFFAPGGLKTMPLAAGSPTLIWATSEFLDEQRGRGTGPGYARGGFWSSDGTIVFSENESSGLSRVPETGGPVTIFTKPESERDELGHLWPERLPGEEGVIFTTTGRNDTEPFSLCIHSPNGAGHRVIVDGGRFGRYAQSGHLIYAAGHSMLAVPFDIESRRVTGTPVRVLEGLHGGDGTGSAHFAMSDSGTLVYAQGAASDAKSVPVWIAADGRSIPVKNGPVGSYNDASLSPTGEQAAFNVRRGPWQDLWVYDIPRSTWRRLTTAAPAEMAPVFLPERGSIVFSSNAQGPSDLYSMPSDGSAEAVPLFRNKNYKAATSWSPITKLLAYVELTTSNQTDIWLLDLSGTPKPEPFLTTKSRENSPDFSPNGNWLAYDSDESGNPEVFIRPVRRGGSKLQVSSEGGYAPRWSRDGRQIFYIDDGKLMVVGIAESGNALRIGKPVVRAHHDYFSGLVPNYGVAPDGRVLMLGVEGTQRVADRLVVIQNFFSELTKSASSR